MARKRYVYEPDYAVPPGDTLLETIECLNISQAELAERTGRPTKTLNGIIKGKVAITAETAIQLERVLGVDAGFWLKLESNYQEAVARIKEKEALQTELEWLKSIPIKEMIAYKWIPASKDSIELIRSALQFFGVASVSAWKNHWANPEVSYRKSLCFESNPGSLTAWLRKGEITAQALSCGPYNRAKFLEALKEIRTLTREDPGVFVPRMISLCAEAGVALVFVRELPKCPVSGAARWLSPDKAVIQLTLRHRFDDHFWFSFFHEAGHILNPRKRDIFVDSDADPNTAEEEEANRLARNSLIPDAAYRVLLQSRPISRKKVISFAEQQKIAPGIVVGRLQHDKVIEYKHLNNLKRKFVWAD